MWGGQSCLQPSFQAALPSWALFPALAVFAYAQDAGMVLRTSVTYNTQRASLPLSDEQRQQAEALGRKAQQAGQAGQFGDAIRYYYQGQAVMRKVPWTPALEFASSLQGKLDHALVEPGKQVTVKMTALYASPKDPGAKLSATVVLVPAKKGPAEQVLAAGLVIDPALVPFQTRVTIPAAATGDYAIEARLTASGDSATGSPWNKTLPIHVEALSGAADRLRARIAKDQREKTKAGFPTAEYALALYENADSGEINPNRLNFNDEFA